MVISERKYYLYKHIRVDKDEVFYIGIGTQPLNAKCHGQLYRRAFNKINRNIFWKRIVEKTKYEIEIVLESNNLEFIKQKEIEFIALYGRRDLNLGTLCNLTDGGDGSLNVVILEDDKRKKLGRVCSQITREKISKAHKGRKFSKERIQQMREISKNQFVSEETRKKLSVIHKGKKRSKKDILKQKLTLMSLNDRNLIEKYYLEGKSYTEIIKLSGHSRNGIIAHLKNNNLLKKKYTVIREDGLKFHTMREADKSINMAMGSVSNSIIKGIKCGGYKWIRINEIIK